jgi:hypothetical protein
VTNDSDDRQEVIMTTGSQVPVGSGFIRAVW